MCGRFTLTTRDFHSVARALEAEISPEDAASYRPRYNIAPGDAHWAVTAGPSGARRMGPAHWGLPGRPDRPAARPQGHINTRAETIHTRPSFRDAFAHRRCVIPADGFYEWTGPRNQRLPIWFHPPHGVVAFAGLFGEHVDPRTGEVQLRFSIVTTAANARVATAHDRMPVILAAPAIARWLAPAEPRELDDLRKLLVPASDDLLLATEVSSRANHVANDDPACIVETPHPRQESLF